MNTVSQAGPPSPPRAESPMTLAPDSAQPAQQDTEHICTLLSILVLPQGKWPQSFLMSGPNPSAAWLPEVLEPPKGPFSSLSHCPPPPRQSTWFTSAHKAHFWGTVVTSAGLELATEPTPRHIKPFLSSGATGSAKTKDDPGSLWSLRPSVAGRGKDTPRDPHGSQ